MRLKIFVLLLAVGLASCSDRGEKASASLRSVARNCAGTMTITAYYSSVWNSVTATCDDTDKVAMAKEQENP